MGMRTVESPPSWKDKILDYEIETWGEPGLCSLPAPLKR